MLEVGPAGLGALLILLVAGFAVLARTAAAGSAGARVAALAGVLVLTAGAGLAVLASLALFALKCDESCDENMSPEVRTGEWWHTLDAWQWPVQLLLAVTLLGLLLAVVVQTGLRRYGSATALLVAAAAAFAAWAAMLSPLGDRFGI